MPYIKKSERELFDSSIAEIVKLMGGPGELNYVITKLADGLIKEKGLNYATINRVVGVLECAKLELYRRVAAPYENTKIITNGDVYDE